MVFVRDSVCGALRGSWWGHLRIFHGAWLGTVGRTTGWGASLSSALDPALLALGCWLHFLELSTLLRLCRRVWLTAKSRGRIRLWASIVQRALCNSL